MMRVEIEHCRKGSTWWTLSLSPGARGISLRKVAVVGGAIYPVCTTSERAHTHTYIYIYAHQWRPCSPMESMDSRMFESEVGVLSLCPND